MHNEHSIAAAQGVWNYLQAAAYARVRGQGPYPAPSGTFTVAISREAGIDAGDYARAIGQQLGWPVWDHELLELVASRLGSDVHDLESLDERHVSWIQESLEAFLLLHSVNQHVFVRRLREAMEELAALGNCIIVGRGAPTFCRRKPRSRCGSSRRSNNDWQRFAGRWVFPTPDTPPASWKRSTASEFAS